MSFLSFLSSFFAVFYFYFSFYLNESITNVFIGLVRLIRVGGRLSRQGGEARPLAPGRRPPATPRP